MAARAREGLMSDLSPAEQKEIRDRMARWERSARKDRVKKKAREFWDSPLPFALVVVAVWGGAVWLRKRKEAESAQALQNP